MTSRGRLLRGPIAFWALAGIALLVSHDAIFFVQYGPGEPLTRALRDAGHAYWAVASLAVAAIGAVVAASITFRLLRLRARARRLATVREPVPSEWSRRLLVTWGRLFAIVAIGFVIQESAEHFAMHGHAIGVGAFIGPEYPLALPILGLVTLAAALVAVYVTGVAASLEATIAAAVRLLRAPLRITRPPLALVLPRIPVLARAAAGRAPPDVLIRHP
jgi:hypothetical protein